MLHEWRRRNRNRAIKDRIVFLSFQSVAVPSKCILIGSRCIIISSYCKNLSKDLIEKMELNESVKVLSPQLEELFTPFRSIKLCFSVFSIILGNIEGNMSQFFFWETGFWSASSVLVSTAF
jgi:hypothetical protein